MEQLYDGHGRQISDIRVSVTDRCNFRCQYCMPAEGLPWIEREEILRFEEIERLVSLFVEMGVSDVRLTGGEPLVRRNFPKLVAMLASTQGLTDLSLTTNAYLLNRDAKALIEAGIDRMNVSLDSIVRDRFAEIARRDALPEVLEGLEELERFPEVHPIKINAVAIKGFTEKEMFGLVELARKKPYQVRFIEYMPLDAAQLWKQEEVLTGIEVRKMIEAVYPLEELEREQHATASVYRFSDGKGEIGFINPLSEPFCESCNRLRLTAEGKLRTCLFSHYETDLRGPMRAGASDGELEEVIRDAVWQKELKHRVGEEGFRQPLRSMSQIGG